MRGREFLDLAKEMIRGATEKHWRGAAGRAYYALMLECREALLRWGIPMFPNESAHRFVRTRIIVSGGRDARLIVDWFDRLAALRNKADYVLTTLSEFSSSARTRLALQEADSALACLDAIETDPARLAAAIAAIRAAFP